MTAINSVANIDSGSLAPLPISLPSISDTKPWLQPPMNLAGLGPGLASRPQPRSDNCILTIRQQPESAKVVPRGKDRDRKPIDPPPIVQLVVQDEYNNVCSYLHNPHFFCIATLLEAENDTPKTSDDPESTPALIGTTVSSMYRLKDLNNAEGGFFIFGDLSSRISGTVRIKFTLYELRGPNNEAVVLTTTISQTFEVANAKDWDGVRESTILSRSFADQGVRLRLRKESRNSASRRSYAPNSGPSSIPHTPIRPQATSHSTSFDSSGSTQDEAARRQQQQQQSRGFVPSTAANTYSMGAPPMGGYQQPLYGATSSQGSGYQNYGAYAGGYGYGSSQSQGYSYPPQRGPQTSDAASFLPHYAGSTTQGASNQYSQPYQTGYNYGSFSQPSSYSPQASYPQYSNQSSQMSNYRQPSYMSNSSMSGSMPPRSMANPSATPRLPPINQGGSGAIMPSIEDPGQAQAGGQAQLSDQRGMPGTSSGGSAY